MILGKFRNINQSTVLIRVLALFSGKLIHFNLFGYCDTKNRVYQPLPKGYFDTSTTLIHYYVFSVSKLLNKEPIHYISEMEKM